MTLKKNHITSIFKKLRINRDWTNPNTGLNRKTDHHTETQNLNNDSERNETLNSLSLNSQGAADDLSISKSQYNLIVENSSSATNLTLTGYSRIQELKLVKVGIASSDQIISWAEKLLPNGKIFGEVLNANTLHYKTFKPQKGGLFCQRIFGPLKDFECACGIVRKPSSEETLVQSLVQDRKPKRTYCSVCDVEYTWSVIRRYQLGYIQLASPVTHLWYLKANPSYLSMLLDLRKKDLEDIIYCSHTLTLEDYWRPLRTAPMSLNPTLFFESYKKYLAGPNQNMGNQEPWDLLKKKQITEKQKRIKVKPRRRMISYLNTKSLSLDKSNNAPAFPGLALLSKQDQIAARESLEIAYKLSTDDYEARKFSRLTNVARILMEKKIADTQKELFLKARTFGLAEFYERLFESFSKKSFLTTYKLSLEQSNISKTDVTPFFFRNSTPLASKLKLHTLKREENFIFNSRSSSLKEVLKNHWSKRKLSHDFRRRNVRTEPTFRMTAVSWGVGNYYRYVNTKAENLGLIDPSFLETVKSEKKNAFLTAFFRFLRKPKLEENWESIYNYPREALLSFSNSKRNFSIQAFSSSSDFLVKFLDHIFSNSVVLYLLFLVQTKIDSLFVSRFLLSQKKLLLEFILGESTGNLLFKQRVDSLKDLLNIDFVSKKLHVKKFIETEIMLQSVKLTKFSSLTSQPILKIYLLQQFLQKKSFYRKKTFKIFFVQKKQNEDVIQIQTKISSTLQKSSYSERQKFKSHSFNQIIQTNVENLIKSKKIFSFVKNRPNYPQDSFSYLKNILQIRNKALQLKQQKLSSSFQIFNNIYTTSYLESWQTEKDWKYFLYYNKAFVEDLDLLIPGYSYRFPRFTREAVVAYSDSQKPVAKHLDQALSTILKEDTLGREGIRAQNALQAIEKNDQMPDKTPEDSHLQTDIMKFTTDYQDPNLDKSFGKTQSDVVADKEIWHERPLDLTGSEKVSAKSIPVIGANILQKLLLQYEGLELKKMAKQHQNVIPKFNRYIRYRKQTAVKKSDYVEVQKLLQTRDNLIRRLKLLRKLFKKNTKTSSMILNTIPVLPPDLRPILKMQNQIAASDLNRFYQRILYRNDRLKKFIRANAAMMNSEPAFEVKYAQRLLQEAVDNLIQNGKGQVKPETNSRGQSLKSLSEILKGKQGRFRQYLLGKRVDYSGRSVIVVGPTLKIYECGLPFEMAIELFLPFLIKRIFQYGLARTVMGAKTLLKNDFKTTWHLLEEIMQHHPILLNRAPTLHRLGIQAFRPKLITGRAILLHPLVCPAFNADFDGDQMAVHVPITVEARTEAWKLMFSRNHLISSATGEPILLPTQDMVLGCYYLTTTSSQDQRYNTGYPFSSVTSFYFSNMKQILQAYLQEKIHLQTPIWMRWNGILQFDSHSATPYEIRVMPDGSWLEIQSEYHRKWSPTGQWNHLFVRTTPGRIIFNLMIQSCIETKP